MRSSVRLAVSLVAGLLAANLANAQFSAGNLAISRVGTGAAALSSAATASFIDQYTSAGGFVNSLAMPTAGSGTNLRLVNSGSATSELQLNLSPDGLYLTLGGYDAALGTASIATTTGAIANRVIGRVHMNGAVNTSTTLGTTLYSGGNIRSAYTTTGSDFWATGSNTGIVYSGLGGAGAAAISTTSTNTREVQSVGGDLYFTTGAGTRGFYRIAGNPTSGSNTATLVFATGATSSPYDFIFKDASTVYIADDAAGLQKWVNTGGTWSVAYSITAGAQFFRSLATNGTSIFGITTESNANRLVMTQDLGGSFSAVTTLATASTNTAFRGVEFLTVPEPASVAALCLGVAGLLARRRRVRKG